jgi:hypothetical protein
MARKDEAERKAVFRCYRSRALIKGEELSFDGGISARLKAQAVCRGFIGERSKLRRKLSPLERMVIRMREATTGEEYNHEWWADWVSTPDWFKKFHEVILESWLFYPPEGSELEPRKLGDKIGYEFEYKRRKFERASGDPEFVERWKLAEYGLPEPVVLPPEWKDEKVVHHFVIDGYTDWKEYAIESLRKLKVIQAKILQLCSKLGADFVPFAKGMSTGAERAQRVDLDDDLAGSDERDNILQILERNYDLIAQLRNRREIADFIIARLPEGRREFLKNEAQYRAFIERLRHTYFSKIDLRPAARGMPRKSEKMTPHRSRILIYTPDIASRRETKSM